jgi:hypothetical protein
VAAGGAIRSSSNLTIVVDAADANGTICFFQVNAQTEIITAASQ